MGKPAMTPSHLEAGDRDKEPQLSLVTHGGDEGIVDHLLDNRLWSGCRHRLCGGNDRRVSVRANLRKHTDIESDGHTALAPEALHLSHPI